MIGLSLIYDLLHRLILLWLRADDDYLRMNSRVLCLIIEEIPRDITTSDKACSFPSRIEL
jgi:hypothetical protein